MTRTSPGRCIVVLDALFADLTVEAETAAAQGWHLQGWDGSAEELARATIVLHVRTPIDRAMISRLVECRVIGRFGTGLDTVDHAAARDAGISVVGVTGYCTPEMTMHTLALGTSVLRGVGSGWANGVRQAMTWSEMTAHGRIANPQLALVVGYGAIGSAVARAFSALGLQVKVATRSGRGPAQAAGHDVVPLERGLAAADLVSLHVALTAETELIIGEHSVNTIKQGTVLINTARLGLMDQEQVAQALASGRLGGLGLDARLPAESPLRRVLDLPQVLVTPHTGWYSPRSANVLRTETVIRSIAAADRDDGCAAPPNRHRTEA
jgi:phosphoglycerate dehydrogenase-like enzyme